MYMQSLHHFCNIHTPDNGPRSGCSKLTMTYGIFIYQLPPDTIKYILQLEKIYKNM